ncbi:MAG: protein-methionine-sulfoxide reductase catalytic subunit MsrP, partial [Steroidobacteraceae bacterium]
MPMRPSEITPEAIYRGRREFLAGLAGLGAGALLSAPARAEQVMNVMLIEKLDYKRNSRYSTMEAPNSLPDITGYNNFY